MHRSSYLVLLPTVAALFCAQNTAQAAEPAKTETPEQFEARLAPWRAARFGMFIHWGPVSLKGTEIGWSRGSQVPIEEYDNLYKKFNPVKFNADAWVSVAKAAGMKYVVLTTKHHDGFCLWDTKQTDHNIMNTPFHRDVTKELAVACRKQGLAFGTYYSTCDWRHPDFPLTSPGGSVKRATSNLDRYTDYLKAQTTELVKNYGPLFTLWFDVPQEFNAVRGQGVIDLLRTLQPNLVINNRTGAAGDYDTPEQTIGGFQMNRPWETCMTICDQWAWKPNDNMKSLQQCVSTLLSTIGGDGNLLFNVGPSPDGEIEGRQVERLKEMGAWATKHGASIYGTRGGPYKPGDWGVATRSDKRITLFVMNWPSDGHLILPALPAKIISATTVSGAAVKVENGPEHLAVIAPPEAARDAIATAIILTIDTPAMSLAPLTVNKMAGGRLAMASATASNTFESKAEYGADKAIDGDAGTRWATDSGLKEVWLAVDLGVEQLVAKAQVDEGSWDRVRRYEIQVKVGDQWKSVIAGKKIDTKPIPFPAPVKGREFRLMILEASESPTIHEFALYR